jgi:hypoxanthine phosphoribosyltransferase
MSGERELLLSGEEIARRMEVMAARIAAETTDDTICVCLLTGGIWFAADMTRALSRRGRNPLFDALWLASYGDDRATSGRVIVRTGLQRSVKGAQVLLLDDVLDSGLSLLAARKLVLDEGAAEVKIAVFARKPWPEPRDITPDYVLWDAPARFLVGYGMDDKGRLRGLPGVEAVD